jgi:hypothetical protein
VHQQQLNVLGVADEEGLVAGGHHVASLLVGAETDLIITSNISLQIPPSELNTISSAWECCPPGVGRNVPRA